MFHPEAKRSIAGVKSLSDRDFCKILPSIIHLYSESLYDRLDSLSATTFKAPGKWAAVSHILWVIQNSQMATYIERQLSL
jgi:hypothetical protein